MIADRKQETREQEAGKPRLGIVGMEQRNGNGKGSQETRERKARSEDENRDALKDGDQGVKQRPT